MSKGSSVKGNKRGNVLAGIGIAILVIFISYSILLLTRPKPLEVQGEVEATQIRVASKLVGRIDSLPIHKGDIVKKGQLLFMLNSPEIEARMMQASAGLKGAQAQNRKANNGAQQEDIQAAYTNYLKSQAASDLANKTYQRIQNLYKEGVVPAQKRDEAETQMKAANETTNGAIAIWEKAKNGTRSEDKISAIAMVDRAEGAINEVKSYLNETNIFAPLNAEVANIIAERGELISAGYPVVTLVNLDDCWITFNLREDMLSAIKKGSIIEAKFVALGNKMIKLKITYITVLGSFATWNATKTAGDFDMKTFEVHGVPIEKVEGLRPGMSALVDWRNVVKASK